MGKTHTIIYEGVGGERIDVYLTHNHEYTRNFFHRLVARGDILVNGTIVKKKSLWLKTNDEITIVHPERYMESEVLAQSPEIELKILIEKPDYIVIYKPKWVLSHPNSVRWVEHANIVWALYHYYKKQNLPTTGNFIRAGLIHRLDKETDWLMLIVKTEAGLKYFKDLFQCKSLAETIEEKDQVPLKKFYRAQALVTPKWKKFLDTITLPHIIQEMVIPKVPHYEPKMGITKIVSCEIQDDMANLEIEILTGRTHQIRYHLSKHGLPIIGDYLYMDKSTYNEDDIMHLQAYRLSFTDIDGEYIDVQCERNW
jgi:23S rRNA pseudouridine1911/1915/1917 synthase